MNPALWAALGGAAALLLLLLGAGVAALLVGHRARARAAAADAAERSDVDLLRARVEELSAELAATRGAVPGRESAEYVITTAGEPGRSDLPQVPDRAVLSVTLGEPLVRLAAFGYGLRRALSPESRNRIAFEMRREVRRARKARRRAARRTRMTASQEEAA